MSRKNYKDIADKSKTGERITLRGYKPTYRMSRDGERGAGVNIKIHINPWRGVRFAASPLKQDKSRTRRAERSKRITLKRPTYSYFTSLGT